MKANRAKQYESNLALAYVHSNNSRIFQYISSIKGNNWYPTPIFSTSTNGLRQSPAIQQIFLFSIHFQWTAGKEQMALICSKKLQHLNLRYLKFLRPLTLAKCVESTTSVQSYSKTVLHLYSKLSVTCFPQVYDATLPHRNGVPIVWSLFKTGDKSSVSNFPHFVFSPKY